MASLVTTPTSPSLDARATVRPENTTETCARTAGLAPDVFVYFCVSSVFVIFFHSWTVRRKKMLLDSCGGRPGITIPLDFLQSEHHRAAYAFAYGATTSMCLGLFLSAGDVGLSNVWLSFLVRVAVVILGGLLYYPVFLGLHYAHRFFGVLIGTVYTACLFSMKTSNLADCLKILDSTNGKVANSLLFIPELLCLVFLIIYFGVQIAHVVHWKFERRTLFESLPHRGFEESWEAKYVVQLLRPRSDVSSDLHVVGQTPPMWKRCLLKIYDGQDEFRYSIRILAPMVVSTIALYEVCLALLYIYIVLGEELQSIADDIHKHNGSSLFSEKTRHDIYLGIKHGAQVLEGGGVASVFISLILSIAYVLFICHSYKRSMKQLYRGDHYLQKNEGGLQGMGDVSRMMRFMRFMGYQTAYILAGFVVVYLVIFLVICVFGGFVVYAQIVGESSALTTIYNLLAPLLVVGLLYGINVFFTYFVFLEKDEKGLVFANRRFFNNFNYFNFFFNMMLGLGSSLLRVIFSVVFGTFMLPRLDRPLLMQGFTRWDFGYQTFLGFIAVELEVTHPCLVVFTNLLVRSLCNEDSLPVMAMNSGRYGAIEPASIQDNMPPFGVMSSAVPQAASIRRLVRNRWHLAVTLVNNPTLVAFRKCHRQHQKSHLEESSNA